MSTELTVQQIRDRVGRVAQVMKAVMKDGVHFGKIPGCGPKPTLLKPGAEKLCLTFRLAAEAEVLAQTVTGAEVSYMVRVTLTHISTGEVWGSGVGSCSSQEERYAWREALCDEEWNVTDPADRRIKYRKKWKDSKPTIETVKQIATNPADVANTILKMAKKRAFVDATLTATAASDIFTQDVEDAAGGNGEAAPPKGASPPGQAQPKAPPQTAGAKPAPKNPDAPASEKQRKAVCAIWAKTLGYSFGDLQEYLADNEHFTMSVASDLIDMSNEGNLDVTKFQELTGVIPNVPPPEAANA
jgi:hypothetical protein